ncbi:hypothetical protein BDW22DRAFT_1339734 [Trametopsis cervina]|nr:hypothetical protein BDW22DRAFT_1339734 [Trametopsis cervina]
MTQRYILAMDPISRLLTAIVEDLFPQESAAMKQAFKAGRCYREEENGSFLGHAIIWKLQTEVHQDASDHGICICIPTGAFSGGELFLPDLKAKLRRYGRGDIVVFRSRALVHGVFTWKPVGISNTNSVSAGRVSHVFFNHDTAFNILKNKPVEWRMRTAGGALPLL